jgi:hypothetical protein
MDMISSGWKISQNQNCLETFDHYLRWYKFIAKLAQNLILIVDFVNMAVWLMEFYNSRKYNFLDVDLHNDQIKLLLIFI